MEERTGSVPAFVVHGLWLLLFFGAPAALAAAYVTQQGKAGFETWKTLAECAVYLLWCGCAVRFFRLTTRRISSFGVGLLAAAVVSLGLTAAVFLFNNLLHFLQYAVSAGAFCSSPLGYGWFLREDLLYQEGAGPLRYVLAFTTTLMFCVLFLAARLYGEEMARIMEQKMELFEEFICGDDDDGDDDGDDNNNNNDGLPW